MDCIAGSGKTTLLEAFVKLHVCQLQPEEYIIVAAPNKPMVQKLVSLLGQSLEGVAPSGIVWEKDTPKDLPTQHLETKGGCHSLLSRHLQTVEAACERIQHQEWVMEQRQTWSSWHAAWMALKFVRSLLHVFLFKVLYQVQADAMEEALKEVKVLVGTTAFMRKFLGGSSEWCRSFQNRRVDTLLIDEVHQEAFLGLTGLIARAPRAVLFGDSRQEFAPMTQHSSANQLQAETSFDWVGRAGMPTFQLNGTFRVGENICRVLRVTGDHPDAVSEAAAPSTVFLPVLFEASDRICAAGGEVFFHLQMFAHLVYLVSVEILLAGMRRVERDILVIVYYASQKVFLGEHLAYSCRSCLEGLASALDFQVPESCWGMFEKVRIELPGAAGGAEVDVALLYVPRRAPDDKTYAGRHLLSPAWRYVSLTRARWRTYLLLEELEPPTDSVHVRQRAKIQRWLNVLQHVRQEVWPSLSVKHGYAVTDDAYWHGEPANIVTSAWWQQNMLAKGSPAWRRSYEVVLRHVVDLPLQAPLPKSIACEFGSLFADPAGRDLLLGVEEAERAPRSVVQLPDLREAFPLRHVEGSRVEAGLVDEAEDNLERFADFVVDAMCIHVKSSEITVSVPLVAWVAGAWQADASQVGYALFLSWLGSGAEFGGLVPEVRRHKKREVFLAGELFVEAQCGSDRPAFCLVDGVTEKEAFHFYNAMGLSKQHESLQTLLARVKSVELALKFCQYVSENTPAKFRASQVKGKAEDLQQWKWTELLQASELRSSDALPELADWLAGP